MHKTLWMTSAGVLGLVALAGIALGSDERGGWWGARGSEEARESRLSRADVPPASLAAYTDACGSCHLAYQPGLLPARSWDRIMATLGDHFGDNAELDAAASAEIRRYLADSASDRTGFGRAPAFARSTAASEVPLRVTDTPYFRHKHRELPQRLVAGNPQVRSFSNCQACHRSADKGIYGEHDIVIAGYGRWDD
jgi:mono/diheme cytochrome c family protein